MTDEPASSPSDKPALVPVPNAVTSPADVPSLYDWLGGMNVLLRLTTTFYSRVPDDPILAPVFAHMPPDHPKHVAMFLAEVLGGPAGYSAQHGEREAHPHMVARHLGRSLSEVQRKRWVQLLLECADEIGLPDDAEFRSALVAYLEWGSRLAVLNSQPGVGAAPLAPMPKWGWGVPGGPYRP